MLVFSLPPIHTYIWLSKSLLIKTFTPSPFDFSQEPLHLPKLLTWLFQPNSTYGVESIKYLFRIYPNAQLFGVPNHRSAITWRNTWPRLFTLSISPRFNLVVLVELGWPFTESVQSAVILCLHIQEMHFSHLKYPVFYILFHLLFQILSYLLSYILSYVLS